MDEQTQEILKGEKDYWQEAFLAQWEIMKELNPTITLQESVAISIRLRNWVRNFKI